MAHLVIRFNWFSTFIALLLSLSLPAAAAEVDQNQKNLNYYGAEFLNDYKAGNLSEDEIADRLHEILKSGHIKQADQPDRIVSSCAKSELQKLSDSPAKCQQHRSLGYEQAKQKIFGTLFLKDHGGSYSLGEVYCEKDYTDEDFGGKKTIYPGWKPANADHVNTEHTWPQSKFTGKFEKGMQKADLHHLFPTDTKMNSSRSAFRFGNVYKEKGQLKCKTARLGIPEENSDIVFEAPARHKGNVARAIFYFAVRYQMKLTPAEKATLLLWHNSDPVDAEEEKRNELIEQMQGNRNPFIDFPDLLGRIKSI